MLVYSLILFAVAALFFVIGIRIYRGDTGLIHDYHQGNVRDSDRRAYGRAFSAGIFTLGGSLFLSGLIALFGDGGATQAASLTVLFGGIAASIVLLVRAQKKYNGGMFS